MEQNGDSGDGWEVEVEVAEDEVDGSGFPLEAAYDRAWDNGKRKFGGEAKDYKLKDVYVRGDNPITEYKVVLKRQPSG